MANPAGNSVADTKRSHDLVPASPQLHVTIDEVTVGACTGETVLTVLYALGQRAIARSDRGLITGAYCGMGICHACVVLVDGIKARACQVYVRDGMRIETQKSLFEQLESP